MWITKAYIKILIKAQVSLGSHPQYLPQLSLAHIPPKKFPMVSMINPTIKESSFIMVNSLMFKSIFALFFLLVMEIKISATTPIIILSAKGP